MDQEKRDKLSELVEDLTTSGEPQLNEGKMKEVKKICKISNDYIDHFYHLILTQLNQDHAEIRFSAFQMVTELFSRSHHFRVLLVDFHDVEARTLAERKRQEEKQQRLERIYKEKLDKAKQEMEELSSEIEESLTEINNCMRLLMPDTFSLFSTEPTVVTEEATCSTSEPDQKPRVWEEQPCCSKYLSSGSDGKMTEETRCEEEKEESSEEVDTEEGPDEDTFIRSTGLMSRAYQLDLNVPIDLNVKETEENEAVVNNMRDLHRLISSRHLPLVQSWIQVFMKVGVEEHLIRRATTLKKNLEKALKEHDELHIDYKTRRRKVAKAGEEEDEDDDDFEEVPEKEGYEPHIPEHLRAEYGLDPLPSASTSVAKPSSSKPVVRPAPPIPRTPARHKRKLHDEEQDPTCAAATIRALKERLPSVPSKSVSVGSAEATTSSEQSEEKEKVPVVPFGVDLYYWGEDQPTAGKIIKNTSQHQFWVPHEVEEEVENKELSAQMKSRYITFAGRFQPVEHKCKAPLPNGSLCERQDRIKCPFHGPIIPRDEIGRPINPEDAARLEKEERKRREEQPDWRDPELMREIEAATGEDLGSSRTYGKGKKSGKGKGKKRKHPNLTDLKQTANTSRSRLEKKVFNKSSMRRMAEVMNKIDKRKHEKFANQFNYVFK
ncbi:UV-stimulated scaffold protein A isoform X2 [Hoplias malabaricus]|uniref:UV-stimulated scaffold protein A isoform X2 n=1 Tax=Hoplias malabaricus TaxID=27720 RepID=UPI00346357E2